MCIRCILFSKWLHLGSGFHCSSKPFHLLAWLPQVSLYTASAAHKRARTHTTDAHTSLYFGDIWSYSHMRKELHLGFYSYSTQGSITSTPTSLWDHEEGIFTWRQQKEEIFPIASSRQHDTFLFMHICIFSSNFPDTKFLRFFTRTLYPKHTPHAYTSTRSSCSYFWWEQHHIYNVYSVEHTSSPSPTVHPQIVGGHLQCAMIRVITSSHKNVLWKLTQRRSLYKHTYIHTSQYVAYAEKCRCMHVQKCRWFFLASCELLPTNSTTEHSW